MFEGGEGFVEWSDGVGEGVGGEIGGEFGIGKCVVVNGGKCFDG